MSVKGHKKEQSSLTVVLQVRGNGGNTQTARQDHGPILCEYEGSVLHRGSSVDSGPSFRPKWATPGTFKMETLRSHHRVSVSEYSLNSILIQREAPPICPRPRGLSVTECFPCSSQE